MIRRSHRRAPKRTKGAFSRAGTKYNFLQRKHSRIRGSTRERSLRRSETARPLSRESSSNSDFALTADFHGAKLRETLESGPPDKRAFVEKARQRFYPMSARARRRLFTDNECKPRRTRCASNSSVTSFFAHRLEKKWPA